MTLITLMNNLFFANNFYYEKKQPSTFSKISVVFFSQSRNQFPPSFQPAQEHTILSIQKHCLW